MKGRRRKVVPTLAALGLLAGGLTAAASPAAGAAAAPAQAGKTVTITVGDNFFKPKKVTIEAGTTVRWVNKGRNLHDIKPNKGKKFGKAQLPSGKKYKHTFDDPGKYPYYCSFHGSPGGGQWGVITVKPPPETTPSSEPPPSQPPPSGAFKSTSFAGRAQSSARSAIRVPGDAKTVQAAVDQAKPGDLVLVSPGVYKEAVTVTTPRIVIRGVDRNRTVLDGEFKRANGIKVVEADGVAVENITARNFKVNGFFWTGVDGFRGSYLNAIRNGDYGIYAFDSANGQLDHSYAAGSPDAGFYVGQCKPCNTLVTDVESEWNGLGYSGTNSSGDMFIVNSSWHDNRVGIVPNSGSYEEDFPQEDATIMGNDVYDNNNSKTAAIEIAEIAIGNGVLLAGGSNNIVERNRVEHHDLTGIAAIPLPESVTRPDDPESIDFEARGNRVVDNVVDGSGEADLVLVTNLTSDTETGANCFSGNEHATSLPADLQAMVPCDGPVSPAFKAPIGRFAELLLADKPPAVDYRKVKLPEPPKLPNMPNARKAKARPAVAEPSIRVNLDEIEVPTTR